MKHYALIGNPLGHSWSQRLFEEAVPHDMADYQLCEMTSLDGLRQWVSDNDISGFNVTLPYKEAILPYLDTLTSEAKEIGAVNCVKVMDGKLIGYNTDAPAFRHTLEDTLSTLHSPLSTLHSAFILGTGGAARAVAYALSQIGINYTFVSRHPELHPNSIGYNQIIQTIKQSSNQAILLVNATPVGTWPNVDATPLDFTLAFTNSHIHTLILYDLIYNPSPTLLMRQAAAKGAKVVDGLAMLRLQAKLSRDIFFADNTEYQPIAK